MYNYVDDLFLDFIQEQKFKFTFEDYLNHEWQYARTEDYFVYLVGLLIYSYYDDFGYENSSVYKLINLLIKTKLLFLRHIYLYSILYRVYVM